MFSVVKHHKNQLVKVCDELAQPFSFESKLNYHYISVAQALLSLFFYFLHIQGLLSYVLNS